jgi:hypothetical protein
MKIEYKKDGIITGDVFLLLSDIIKECNNIKIKEDKLVLLEIGWDGRGGSVFEQIALPKKNALRVKDILLNKEAYFGEIWGKHSEVYGEIIDRNFKIVADKKKIKSFLEEYPSGHEYDHSFIYTFVENNEENEMQEGVTQEMLDELKTLIR